MLLDTRRMMPLDALRSVLREGVKHLDRARLQALAGTALADVAVTGPHGRIWSFVAFALDPVGQLPRAPLPAKA
jgi:hypothetical protein